VLYLATVRDVAERAQVATATVSRVINGSPHVSEQLRSRVLRAIQELNYVPDRAARNLRTRTARVIGLIVSDIRNPFSSEISAGVEDAAYARGYTVLLGNTNLDRARERLYFETLLAERAAGVVVMPTGKRSDTCRQLVRSGIPVVAIDRAFTSPKTDVVLLDNRLGAALAVDHLTALGHGRIAMLAGSSSVQTNAERIDGFQQALRGHGIELCSDMIRESIPDPSQAQTEATALLKTRPTAVVVGSNVVMLGVLQALRALRLKMPDDVSVIAFDDPPWAVALPVRLTVIGQPTFEIGATATKLLLERIGGSDAPPREIRLPPELRVRESTGPPAA
jgi:DNA-binding LacI/PurR family transcriptional regulator